MSTHRTTLAITGMSCGSCAHHIDQALRAVPGVTQVTVDRAAQRAVVLHDPSTVPDALITATAEAGYDATVVA
jgi:copper chaperone CopZ